MKRKFSRKLGLVRETLSSVSGAAWHRTSLRCHETILICTVQQSCGGGCTAYTACNCSGYNTCVDTCNNCGTDGCNTLTICV